ncbi:RyR domain-containing protein [Ralstonia insidiosa]|uniref:Ryanodine receptor Ryr domain-containing protein n=1 Tax=Ralstonia insidiosa TaxID=190721 RepID=A0A848NZR5_9RALS|nr:RyR domain-containing protein [Ralstonia insidiosa]NMV38565.1 hypothetical protein [Ralstonia insidiosa]
MQPIKQDRFDRLRWWYRRNAWLLFAGGMLIGVLMAVWGFNVGKGFYFGADTRLQWADAAYYILQMISLNGFGPLNPEIPWQLNVARFWLPTVFFFTALSGVLRVVGRNGVGLSRYFLDQHIIVCGHGAQAIELVRQYRSRATPAEVLLVSSVNEFSGAADLRSLGAMLHMDDIGTVSSWRTMRAERAKAIYFLEEGEHRNLNGFEALCRSEAGRSRSDGKRICKCFIHVGDSALRRWVVESLENMQQARIPHRLQWFVFSAWEQCARDLFLLHGPHLTQSALGPHAPPSMLILGASPLAEQLLMQAAKLGHYPGAGKLQVTLVAPDAAAFEQSLKARFPALDGRIPERWDPEERALIPLLDLTCVSAAAEAPPLDLLGVGQREGAPFQVCFVCVDDAHTAVRAVDMLRAQYRDAGGRQPGLRTVVCLPQGSGVLERLAHAPSNALSAGLTLFDPLAYSCRMETHESVLVEQSERDAQDIYRFFVNGQAFDWWGLSELERDSNRQAADHLKVKRHFLAHGDEAQMQAEHTRWCAERLLAGWRFGPVKDLKKRISPNLRPYEALPSVEQEKNRPIIQYARRPVPARVP